MFQIESDDEQDASHVEIALEEDPRNDDVEEDSLKRKRKSTSSSLEDLRNTNKLQARAASVCTQSAKKKDFSIQYSEAVQDQLKFQQIKLEFEKESREIELQLKREEFEDRRKAREEERIERGKEREEERIERGKEREEDLSKSANDKKGTMIEKLAASGKTIEEIKAYLELFDQLYTVK